MFPSRIAFRNFTLGQDGSGYAARLLHTAKDSKARPHLLAANGAAVTLQHVVHTYDGAVERLYIDGVEQSATVALSGNYSNWDPSDLFHIGNEGSSERPYGGEIYLVAVYDRALSPAEVQQNLTAGESTSGPGPGP